MKESLRKKNIFAPKICKKVLLTFILIFCLSFGACYIPTNNSSSSSGGFSPDDGAEVNVNIAVTDPTLYSEYLAESLPVVIKRISKSVVGVQIQRDGKSINASGIVVATSKDGLYTYVATSHSLIAGASSVTVKNYERMDEFSASPVGTDPVTDICVIRINANLTPAVLYSDFSTLLAGESVVGISDSLGAQGVSSSSGIVSFVGYAYDSGENNVNDILVADLDCYTATLGSGVFSQTGGFLLGMVRHGNKESSYSYVVPADHLRVVCSQIIQKGYVEGRYKFGIEVEDNKSSWGITESVAITHLSEDGTLYAKGLGLMVGDNVMSMTYKGTLYTIHRKEDLYSYLYNIDFAIGDIITFTIERKGTSSQVSVAIEQYDYFSFNG